jgi:hypothetical protein
LSIENNVSLQGNSYSLKKESNQNGDMEWMRRLTRFNQKPVLVIVLFILFVSTSVFGKGDNLPKDTNNTYTQVYKTNVYWEDIPRSKQDSILRHTDSDLLSLYQGKIVVSDNDESFKLLNKLCHKESGMKQALYFLLFNKIIEEADGALAEVMGEYCMRFVDKNADFVLPYLASHEEFCKLYASFIATELYYNEKSLSDYKKKTLPLMKPDTKPAFETFLKRIEKESVKIVE